ncbi:MAG TPA: hypothetical protein VE397_03030 [Stellaceae bacterium]|nr:hypothetical protein [Stellaceae bacterium]
MAQGQMPSATPAPVPSATPAPMEVVRAPDEVRACLCKEQAVSSLEAEVQAQKRAYDEKRQTFEALDKQVQTSRPQVNVNNPSDVDAFKRLLAQRDAAADTLDGPATASYDAAVKNYNAAVSDYNTSCAGKAFDQDVMARVKQSLACPRQ